MSNTTELQSLINNMQMFFDDELDVTMFPDFKFISKDDSSVNNMIDIYKFENIKSLNNYYVYVDDYFNITTTVLIRHKIPK